MSLIKIIVEKTNDSLASKLIPKGFGAFAGALFAFIFYIILEKWKTKYEWRKRCREEYAYLERYLYDLRTALADNKRTLEVIMESYNQREINFLSLADLPIRTGASMRIDDQLFINRIEIYASNEIKRLNRWQASFNRLRDKINDNLVSPDLSIKKSAENNLRVIIEEAEDVIKRYNYQIDAVDEMIFENRVLLRKHKKWNYNQDKTRELYDERRKEIEEEKRINPSLLKDNPLRRGYC